LWDFTLWASGQEEEEEEEEEFVTKRTRMNE
jgi:hypothetical protein